MLVISVCFLARRFLLAIQKTEKNKLTQATTFRIFSHHKKKKDNEKNFSIFEKKWPT